MNYEVKPLTKSQRAIIREVCHIQIENIKVCYRTDPNDMRAAYIKIGVDPEEYDVALADLVVKFEQVLEDPNLVFRTLNFTEFGLVIHVLFNYFDNREELKLSMPGLWRKVFAVQEILENMENPNFINPN